MNIRMLRYPDNSINEVNTAMEIHMPINGAGRTIKIIADVIMMVMSSRSLFSNKTLRGERSFEKRMVKIVHMIRISVVEIYTPTNPFP